MTVYTFWWDDKNIEHIANHGVEPYEAEEVIDNALLTKKAGQGKYLAYGQTDSGRYLLVVFAPKSHRRLRVVTARYDGCREESFQAPVNMFSRKKTNQNAKVARIQHGRRTGGLDR